MAGIALDDRQRLDWLRLIRSESIGPRTFRSLLSRFGTAAAALDALPDLARQAGRALKLCTHAEAERELTAMQRHGARLIALGENAYPKALQATDAAPPLLVVLGTAEVVLRPCVAIVGSRNASAAGLKFAARLARDLGEAGFVVVSGLARGIDTMAHEASLASGTVAVLAGGLDEIYPPENLPLLTRLLEHGAAISEMPLGWVPRGRDFPRRNRLISGLSLGTVVVEAARKSGSLITARFAGEQGREVFAVPGSPLDPRSEGCNHLIREGATLVGEASHVLEALTPLLERRAGFGASGSRWAGAPDSGTQPLWDELDMPEIGAAPSVDVTEDAEAAEPALPVQVEDRKRLLALLGKSPTTLDDLVRSSALPAREVGRLLLELELDREVSRLPNGAFVTTTK